MKWAERVTTEDAAVTAHTDRWAVWEDYLKLLKDKGYEEYDRKKPSSENKTGIQLRLIDETKAWSKITLTKGDHAVLFDAGFGSIDKASDLDVNVVSSTPEVLEIWIEFTKDFVNKQKDKQKVRSFSEYWDSNFYYAPGKVLPEGSIVAGKKLNERTLYGYANMFIEGGFSWTSPHTALFELECVDKYTYAYERHRYIVLDGKRSCPNPENMTLIEEQMSYKCSLHFGEKFRDACEK